MNRLTCLVLLCVGAVMVIYGFNALDSLSSSFSRLFTGAPTEKTIWLLIGGVLLFIIGASGLVNNPRKLGPDRA